MKKFFIKIWKIIKSLNFRNPKKTNVIVSEPHTYPYPISHYKPRPTPPDGIIVHSMAQRLGGEHDGLHAGDFLEKIGLSEHYLIEPYGTILKCVNPEFQAYHAGVSRLGDETSLNRTFIGICLLIEGEWEYGAFLDRIKEPEAFTDQHMDSLVWQSKKLVESYGIMTERIARHSDVSGPSVRPDDPKYDPGGGFNWTEFINRIKGAENANYQ